MSFFKRICSKKSHKFSLSVKTTHSATVMLFWKEWFWFKSLPHVSFWTDEKDIASDLKKRNTTCWILRLKTTPHIPNYNLPTCQILNIKKYNASDFEFKEKKRIRFWNWNFTTHQFLNITFLVWSDLEITNSKHIRFWTVEKDIASAFEIK